MTTEREIVTGDDDLKWVYEHMSELDAYSGKWIAVISCKIVASGDSVDSVLDQVEAQGLTDPFVTQIPEDVHRKTYLIA